MSYLLFLLFGSIAFAAYGKANLHNTYIVSIFYLFPFIAVWIFMVGGQYYVGTDYENYLRIFSEKNAIDFYSERNEYSFSSLVVFFQSLGLYGQFFFYFFAAIAVLLYVQISRMVTNSHYALMFFLFITVSSLFHNQMNTLRQCTAVYFVTLSIIEFVYDRKISSFILLLVAMGFHSSAIGVLPLFFFVNRISFTPRWAIFFLLFVALLSLVEFDNLIISLATNISRYAHYVDSEYFEAGVSILNRMTKLAYLPIYLCSVPLLRTTNKLSDLELRLFQFGLLAYLLRTLSVVSSITNRFGFYFYILSLLPIFYYLRELSKSNIKIFTLVCSYIMFIYLLKVLVFPIGEYTYTSVFSIYF